MNEVLDKYHIDFIVDAIDSTKSKFALIKYAYTKGIPSISALGMGNKKDPSMIKISRLDKTDVDPLAKKIRDFARKDRLDLKKINVVYSNELPIKTGSRVIASSMIVPASAGLMCAKAFVDYMEKVK